MDRSNEPFAVVRFLYFNFFAIDKHWYFYFSKSSRQQTTGEIITELARVQLSSNPMFGRNSIHLSKVFGSSISVIGEDEVIISWIEEIH